MEVMIVVEDMRAMMGDFRGGCTRGKWLGACLL